MRLFFLFFFLFYSCQITKFSCAKKQQNSKSRGRRSQLNALPPYNTGSHKWEKKIRCFIEIYKRKEYEDFGFLLNGEKKNYCIIVYILNGELYPVYSPSSHTNYGWRNERTRYVTSETEKSKYKEQQIKKYVNKCKQM